MPTRQDTVIGSMNILELTTLRDPVPAQVSIPSEIANRHHNLMAGWGRPNMSRGLYLRATGAITWAVPLRVPAGIILMDVSLLCWGTGSVTILSPADATGSTLSGQGSDVNELYQLQTAGPIDASEGAASRRAVQVVAAESWDFTDVLLQFQAATSTEFGIQSLVWRPVVRRRT